MKSANETYEGEAQVLFDDVINHLRKQKCRAVNGTSCAYRGEDKTKCAIGGILPDELYFPGLEGIDVIRISKSTWPKVKKIVDFIGTSNMNLAHELQCIHDRKSIDMWEVEFEKLAEFNNLKYEKVEQCTV